MDYKTWRPVDGLENLYEVSSVGEIRAIRREGSPGRILRPQVNQKTGYVKVNLCHNGICISREVHRLVAKAFIPNRSTKPSVNHKNGQRDDNRLSNLEWATAKENTRHAIISGKLPVGSRCTQAKLTENKVRRIRGSYMGALGEQANFARKYGVSTATINDIIHGKIWKHV